MENVNNYIKRVLKQDYVLTKFLDDTSSSELRKIKTHEFKVFFYGGYNEAERTRAILVSSDYINPSFDEFEIRVLEITLSSNIRPVTHRHVLGTLMAQGIKRETLGDIIINDNKVYVFVVSEMVNFIINNIFEINQIGVSIKEIEISDEVIKKGLVQVNHIECLNSSYSIKINDLISIRHFGRVQIKEIVTTTKKDRLVVKVNIKH